MFQNNGDIVENPSLKVVGVGGGGGNAVNRMVLNNVKAEDYIEYIAINTDNQDLRLSKAETTIRIGKQKTRGLGAGADPNVGRDAALESEDDIKKALLGADMVFIAAGMGGGTGTGASPVVARIAHELDAVVIAVVTKPFAYEGPVRMQNAIIGINELRPYCDILVTVENERLLKVCDPNTSYLDAFKECDNVLRQGIQGIAEVIAFPGIINLDFADIKNVLRGKGSAIMGIGVAEGPNRAIQATRNALTSQLLEVSIDGATDAIVNISAGEDLGLVEGQTILEEVKNANSNKDINIIHGITINRDLGDELVVTIIAAGPELRRKIESNQDAIVGITGQLNRGEKLKSFSDLQQLFGDDDTESIKSKNNKQTKKSKTNLPDWLSK